MDIKVNKVEVLKRFPPGDRWIPVEFEGDDVPNDMIFDSLTDGLEWIFKNKNTKKFIVDAENQRVYIIGQEEEVKKPTDNRYSIYGE